MNKFLKRVAAALSILPLALVSPISSLASGMPSIEDIKDIVHDKVQDALGKDNVESNGTGSGAYGGPSTIERVATAHTWHENNGFRCYIVNDEGIPISNLVDFVNYYPWDMNTLKAASNWEIENIPGAREGVDKWFHVTGLFPNKGGDVYKEIVYLSGAKTDPVLVKSGNGKVYKDGHYPAGTSGVKSVARGSFTKDSNGSASNISLVEGKMYLISDLQKALEKAITSKGYASPFSGNFDSRQEVRYTHPETGEECVMLDYIPSGLTSIRGSIVLTGTYMKNLMMRPASIENWETDQNLIINYFVELELPKVNGLGNVDGGNESIFEILDPEVKKYYDDSASKFKGLSEEERKTAKTPMIDTLQHYQAKLAFEPIVWTTPIASGDPSAPEQLPTLQPDPKYNYSLRDDGKYIPELNGGIYWWSDDKIVYGTVTGEAQYLSDRINGIARQQMGSSVPDIRTNEAGWIAWLREHQIMAGGGWMKLERTYMLQKEQFGLAPHDDRGMWLCEKAEKWNTLGYGIMYFGMGLDETITHTWDQPNYPPNNYKPGPSPENSNPDGTPKLPEYPSEGDKYKEKGTDHKFNIVKFYAEKNPDGTYTYTENHTREQAIHTIQIDDEPEYKVDNYYTSPTYVKPTNKTDSYDDWKNSKAPKGTKEGLKAERVQIKPEDPDTTLYIRLVSTPKLLIIKYFPDGSTKQEEIPWVSTYDSSEPSYEYERDKQNPDKPEDIPPTYDSTTGTPGSNPTIVVDPTTKIIYIKYKEVPSSDAPLVLHQNELAHTFTLSDIKELVELKHNFESKEKTGNDTDYHHPGCTYVPGTQNSSGYYYCPGHPCTWHRVIDDSNYSYIISNKKDYRF